MVKLMCIVKDQSLHEAVIEVDDVRQFSFGSRDNSVDTGHVCLWGGSARYGWFEINPSRDYESTYTKSVEAVNIYYFLQGLYNRKGAFSLSVGDILYRVLPLLPGGVNANDAK